MPLFSVGLNHKTAPIEIRERWSFNPTQTIDALSELMNLLPAKEAILLSTCNRTEMYTLLENESNVEQWIHEKYGDVFNKYLYQHRGIDAIKHLLRVASGLDSMMLGETQIFGQLKRAYALANEAGMVRQQLNQLFPAIFAACKNIRSETAIGQHAVSMAYALTQMAKGIFSDLSSCHVLLIGTGEMMELVATHLASHHVEKLSIASRHIENARSMALRFNGEAVSTTNIPTTLETTDIVVSATASELPIIGKGMMERALKQKKHHPIFVADLAVPRDVEPEVSELEDVYLYNVDDLQSVVSQNLKSRESAAKQAEAMIELHAQHHARQLRIANASDTIAQYRQSIENLANAALHGAELELAQGEDPQTVLRRFSKQLTNKILHQPTLKLRDAAYHDKQDMLLSVKKLFESS